MRRSCQDAPPRAGLSRFAPTFVVALALLLLRMLVPRPIGLADNGDGGRILCVLGLDTADLPFEDHVRFSYEAAASRVCEADLVSSQVWIDRLAQAIGHAAGLGSGLHLLLSGALACVWAAACVALVSIGVPLTDRGRLGASVLVWLVAADAAFFGYHVSVLTEGAAFLGIAGTVAGLLLMHRPGRQGLGGAALTFASACLGVYAKPQTVLLLPALMVALLLVRVPQEARRRTLGISGTLVAAVLAVGVGMRAQGGAALNAYEDVNVFNTVFLSIVDGEHDTSADLAALGLPASFARFSGQNAWSPVVLAAEDEVRAHRDRFTHANVGSYFVRHPLRTVQILDRAATAMLQARPPNLGSFGEQSGQPPRAKEYRVAVFSSSTRALAPLGLWALLPLWVLITVATLTAARRGHPEIGAVLVFLWLDGTGQFLIAGLGDGVEGTRHGVIALYCLLLACVFAALTWRTGSSRPGSPAPGGHRP